MSRRLLTLLVVFILSGCSGRPLFQERWVHPTLDSDDAARASERCELEAFDAEARTRHANPPADFNTNRIDRSEEYALLMGERAFRQCMGTAGFRQEEQCIANCDQLHSSRSFTNRKG